MSPRKRPGSNRRCERISNKVFSDTFAKIWRRRPVVSLFSCGSRSGEKMVAGRRAELRFLIGSVLIGRNYRRSGTLLRLSLRRGEEKVEGKTTRSFYRVPLIPANLHGRNDCRVEGKKIALLKVHNVYVGLSVSFTARRENHSRVEEKKRFN